MGIGGIDQRLNRRKIITALLFFGAIVFVAWLSLLKTEWGQRSSSFHIDGANHLSIAETIWQEIDPSTRSNFLILDRYPNLAHRMVAFMAHVTGRDLLQVMAATNGVLVYVSCLLVGIRWVGLMRRRQPAVSEVSILFGLTLAGLTSVFGLGNMVHHFQANYFFPHIFSTVLAMALLLVVQHLESFGVRAVLFFAGTLLLTRMHLVGALWFILAALIHFLGTDLSKRGMLRVLALGGGAMLIGGFTKEVRNMVLIAEGNGGMLLPIGNLTEQPVMIAAIITVPLMLLGYHAVGRIRRGGLAQLAEVLKEQAGLLAVLVLSLVMTLALFGLGKGSVYGLAKLNFLLVIETIGLLFVFSPVMDATASTLGRSGMMRNLGALSLVVVCFSVQRPWKYDVNFNQERLIFHRENLLAAGPQIAAAGERLYPNFNLPPWANFYLYLGVMRQGVDPQSWAWYESNCTIGKAIGPELLTQRPLPSDRIIRFDAPANCWRYTVSGWDNPEGNGCWTRDPPAKMMVSFDPDYRPRRLAVEALALVPEQGDTVEVDVLINGRKVTRWSFTHASDFNFSNFPIRHLDLEPVLGVADRVMRIDFVRVTQTKQDAKTLFLKRMTFH